MAPKEKENENEFREAFYKWVVETSSNEASSGNLIASKSETDVAYDGKPRKAKLSEQLLNSARKLVDVLGELSPSKVEVVIAIDEAHVLCHPVHFDAKYITEPWSMFVVFREAFRSLASAPVWGLFLSTTGKLSQFNPHHEVDPSMRIRNEVFTTVPSFISLAYDLFAPRLKYMSRDGSIRIVNSEGAVSSGPPMKKLRSWNDGESAHEKLTLERATQTEFISRFGRPLFFLQYEHGPLPVRSEIIRLAATKLICADPWRVDFEWQKNRHAYFACLSQRLFLEFNTSNYNIEQETQIAAHLQLCLTVDVDSQFVVSWTPPEPLLAEAAATLMMMDNFKPADLLKRVITGFGISTGDRGEVVALLAITTARDRAVKERIQHLGFSSALRGILNKEEKSTDEPLFRAVPVLDFLKQLLKLDAAMTETQIQGLTEDFKNAYVYFNQFVKPFGQSTCTFYSLLEYLTRGMAVLCANNFPGIDALHGMLFKSLEGLVFLESAMSAIMYQFKNDPKITKSYWMKLLQAINEFLVELLQHVDHPRPLIRILFSMGASKPELCYTRSLVCLNEERKKFVVCHDFWCGGIGDFFVPGKTENNETWQALLRTTMKKEQIYSANFGTSEEATEARKHMVAGACAERTFWSWIESDRPIDDGGETEK